MSLFKKWLLNEMPMKTEGDIPRGVYVYIRTFPNEAIIRYTDRQGKQIKSEDPDHLYLGQVTILRIKNYNGWHVVQSQAVKGFGPLLYDVAMEYATIRGGGLTCDREGPVSMNASDVWEKYYHDRNDVEKIPLPAEFHRDHDTAVSSFIYKKEPERINNLRSLGKLIERY